MPGRHFWCAEEDARLRALWAEGLSNVAIAQRMGRAKNSIVGRSHRLQLPSRPSPIIRGAEPAPPRPQRINNPRGSQAAPGDTLSQLIPAVVLPATRMTTGGREVAMDTRRDAVRGPTLATTQGKPAAFGAVGAARQCQWITNDGRPWRFCDAPSVPGRSWCAHHFARVFQPAWRQAAAEGASHAAAG